MQMQAGQAVQELPKNPSTKQAAMWKRHIPLSLVCLSVFVFILVCNLLTPLLVDDYTYCFSFVDGSPIESVWDIFPSIAAHAQKMNGRHAAHFTAQLFLFLPPVLFKIINAAVFVIGLCLITRIGGKVRPRPLLLGFCLLWLFEPAFGEVNLWLDGACNYLWGYTLCLLWLCPYFDSVDRLADPPIAQRIVWILLGFLAGGWNENVSASAIFMAMLLLGLTFLHRRRVRWDQIASLAAAVGGFLTMALAPAEGKNKIASLSLGMLRDHFVIATKMLATLAPLLVLYTVLVTLAILSGKAGQAVSKSTVLVLGALASNYMMIFASYYYDRSAAFTAVLLVAACLVLLRTLHADGYKKLSACTLSVALLLTSYFAIIGANDIYDTYQAITANQEYLTSCRDADLPVAYLPVVTAETKYSAVKNLKYIDTTDPDTWPNRNMARYYGLDAIYGVPVE